MKARKAKMKAQKAKMNALKDQNEKQNLWDHGRRALGAWV